MYLGIPNPNVIVPLEKMTISAPEIGVAFQVLYNPESYTQSRSTQYSGVESVGGQVLSSQFARSGLEVLSFRLFFDSLSAGSEVGGTAMDKLKFTGNSMLPSIAKQIDVRDYTKKVTNLMLVHENLHRPPYVKLSWSSLQFCGYLLQCQQNFIKFNERGLPVRAWLDCVFLETQSPQALKMGGLVLNSPDTTKFHTVCQGDSLWSMSVEAYGQPEEWRLIADVNGLSNPRRLRSGERLRMPALKK